MSGSVFLSGRCSVAQRVLLFLSVLALWSSSFVQAHPKARNEDLKEHKNFNFFKRYGNSNDMVHLVLGSGILGYGVLQYLLLLEIYRGSFPAWMPRNLHWLRQFWNAETLEPVAWLGFGLWTWIGQLYNIHHSRVGYSNFNLQHLFIGVFLNLMGLLGLLMNYQAVETKFPWKFVSPLTVVLIGYIIILHSQRSAYTHEIHLLFAQAVIASGVLQGLSQFWEQFKPLMCFTVILAGSLLICSSETIDKYFEYSGYDKLTVFMIVLTNTLLIMTITLLAKVIYSKFRGRLLSSAFIELQPQQVDEDYIPVSLEEDEDALAQ